MREPRSRHKIHLKTKNKKIKTNVNNESKSKKTHPLGGVVSISLNSHHRTPLRQLSSHYGPIRASSLTHGARALRHFIQNEHMDLSTWIHLQQGFVNGTSH